MKGQILSFLYQNFKKVVRATVDVERIFSAPNLVLTKLRTRLSDGFIDRIIFLNPSKANFR